MRIYAALGVNSFLNNVIFQHRYPNFLVSFAYAEATKKMPSPPHLMLDSGAFTAWSKGKTVSLEQYAKWAHSQLHRTSRTVAVNLDVIPGAKGREALSGEKKSAMKRSLFNADELRGRGLDVMEVFHQGEPDDFLDALLDRLPEGGILGISPRKGIGVQANLQWQAGLLRYLMQRYTPATLPHMHALGVANIKMLRAFPYYSSDSSSWQAPGMFGSYVGRDGSAKPIAGRLVPHQVGRAGTGTDEAKHYAVRVGLDNLLLLQSDITTLWKQRGVVFEDPA